MEATEIKIVPNTGWVLAEMVTESAKQGTIIVPPTNGLNGLVKMRVLAKSDVDIESTETLCLGDCVLIKKEDLLEYSQCGRKYYLLEGQFVVGKIIGD